MARRKRTPRGFAIFGEYKDTNGNTVRIQQSSRIGGPFCWIFSGNKDGADTYLHMGKYHSVSPHLTRAGSACGKGSAAIRERRRVAVAKLMPQAAQRRCIACHHTFITAFTGLMECPVCRAWMGAVLFTQQGWPHACSRGHGAMHGGDCPECRK